jgi:class 3 adenylate cyclase
MIVAVEDVVPLRHTPEELWPYVADTNAINKAVGLPRAHFTRREAGKGELDVGEYRQWRIPYARWLEHPFEWERPRWFRVLREYTLGPLLRFRGGTELRATERGAEARVWVEMTPRSPLFWPLIRFVVAPRGMRRARQRYEEIDRFLDGLASRPFPARKPRLAAGKARELDQLLAGVSGAGSAPEAVAVLRELLTEAPDEEVHGIRPLALAKERGLEDRPLMEAFFRATVAGAMEMSWELLCPSCHGVKASAPHLQILTQKGHCSACNLDFAADVDEAIEARFSPSPRIRQLDVGAYCVGGPMLTAHRLSSTLIEPGDSRTWSIDLEEGVYLLRSPQAAKQVRVVSGEDGTSELRVALCEEGFEAAPTTLRPGACAFTVENRTAARATLHLDRAERSTVAATPSRMLLYPEFHALFSAEALADGLSIKVGSVGLMFTDLVGSTSLYERAGDARAFHLVAEHFSILRRVIEEHGGAVVKTIGDAVMAAFPDGLAAAKAGLAVQTAIRELPVAGDVDTARLIKVGVHEGPCFIVTQNEQLDYFGSTVNVTARTQHEAAGGEVIMTGDIRARLAEAMPDRAAKAQPFQVRLRGIAQPVQLFRLDCAAD